MYKEKILYTSDGVERDNSLKEAGLIRDWEEAEPYLPVEAEGLSVYKGKTALTCVLITAGQEESIAKVDGVEVLGTYDEIFADQDKMAVYQSVYDMSTQEFTDPETGEKETYTPPKKFATFNLPEPSQEELDQKAKEAQQRMLTDTQIVVQTHQEQKELGVQTDISDDQYKQTLVFRESLRKMAKR